RAGAAAGGSLRSVPPYAGALRPIRRHAVGRRAADAGDRPRHDGGAKAADAGRALARPVAVVRADHFPRAAGAERGGADHAAGGTEPDPDAVLRDARRGAGTRPGGDLRRRRRAGGRSTHPPGLSGIVSAWTFCCRPRCKACWWEALMRWSPSAWA